MADARLRDDGARSRDEADSVRALSPSSNSLDATPPSRGDDSDFLISEPRLFSGLAASSSTTTVDSPFDPLPSEVYVTLPLHDRPDIMFRLGKHGSLRVFVHDVQSSTAVICEARTKMGEPCQLRVLVDHIHVASTSTTAISSHKAHIARFLHDTLSRRFVTLRHIRPAPRSGWVIANVSLDSGQDVATLVRKRFPFVEKFTPTPPIQRRVRFVESSDL